MTDVKNVKFSMAAKVRDSNGVRDVPVDVYEENGRTWVRAIEGETMTDNKIIEAVARAMHKGDRPHKDWGDASEETRLLYLDRALWAVAAHTEALAEQGFVIVPREPTGEMIDAACVDGIKHTSAGTDTYPCGAMARDDRRRA